MQESKGISNIYIEDLLFRFTSIFKGVYSSDRLPNFSKTKHFSCIVNLSVHSQPGTHFVAIFYNKESILYFDSLSLPLLNKHILAFLKSYGTPIVKNTDPIQCLESDFCGYYCILFALMVEFNTTMESFNRMFKKSTCTKNDKLVIELICYILSKI